MVTKHERKGHDCGGNFRLARPGRFTTYSLAGTIRRRLPVITDSANRAALRDCASCPSEVPTVRIKQHSGVRVSRNKQPFPSLPHAIISSMCRATTQTITVTCPAPLSLKTLCPDPHAQHGSGPRQTNRRMGIAGTFFIVTLTDMLRKSVPGSRGRTPAYRQSQQKRSQKVKTKRQPAPSTR